MENMLLSCGVTVIWKKWLYKQPCLTLM